MWSSISIGMLCPTDSKRLILEYNVKVYWYYDIHEALLSCCMLANHCAQVINTYQDWLINGFWENWWVLNAEIMNICSCLLVLSATYINVYKLAFHVQHENMVEVAFCKPFFLLLLLLLPPFLQPVPISLFPLLSCENGFPSGHLLIFHMWLYQDAA